ncbi:hypothetical protein VTJ49DRAFT_5895 [Mycothermus thermophilus]|uniref:C2H2-type domain-containing protein n=1 Tax=Humicola insolens TaxID=85995 RepID=A0ABR3V2G7_HUMIN
MQLFRTPSAEGRHLEEHKSTIKDRGPVGGNKDLLPAVSGLMLHNPGGGLDLPDDVLPAGFSPAEADFEESSGTSTPSIFSTTTSSTLLSSLSSSTTLSTTLSDKSGWARSAKVKVFKANNTHVKTQHGMVENPNAHAWTQPKKLFENPESTESLALLQQVCKSPQERHNEPIDEPVYGPHDPRSPNWDPQRYYYSALQKYKCPHTHCLKSFADADKFREHLLSPEHNSEAKYRCPGCNTSFDTKNGFSMHKTSLTPRCHLHLMYGQTEENTRHRDKSGWWEIKEEKGARPGAMGSVRRCARRLERACCTCAKYIPLVFVYGLTTWACYVLVTLCTTAKSKVEWLGTPAAVAGIFLYLMLNWCYTTAVFTPPGSTTNDHGYSTLPTHNPPVATSFTVKSNGEMRFCKKCQARKPDRAHHCSTCRRCVLKMDHHCPWLATCVGLYNHKAFLLFLIYTTLFSLYCFAASGSWVWAELLSAEAGYVDTLMPVNYIMLCIIAAILGLVIGIFTGWHLYLATRGQTTIECLEKTRYLSPLRRTMHQTYINQHTPGQGIPLPSYGQQLLDLHQNALPGITRPEEGEELRRDPAPRFRDPDDLEARDSARGPQLQAGSRRFTYDEMERLRARRRYQEYLDEQDSSKLPNAFDLGPKRNLLHLFGHNPWLWLLPICNTTGDGWSWEPNPKWLDAREKLARERWEQAERERVAGWGPSVDDDDAGDEEPVSWQTEDLRLAGAGRHYSQPPSRPESSNSSARKAPSKADRVLGRDPNLYADVELSPAARAARQQKAAEAAALQRKRRSPIPVGKELHEYELEEIDRFDEDDDEDDNDNNGTNDATFQAQAQPPPPPQTTTTTTTSTERRSSPLSLAPSNRWRPTGGGGGLPSPRGFGVGGVGLGRTASPGSNGAAATTTTGGGNSNAQSGDDDVD